ncbi:DMT family transporter [Polaromonas sp. UC242_47]|uniref:DMT family transporter n=1 Tax=Polaromonas sp. UC242_47 TaxID=3374626 RepID=UPI003794BE68
MNTRTSAALAWGGVLLAGVLWGVGALVAQSVMEDGGMSPFSLSLARFALGLPLLWWWHWQQSARAPAAGRWRHLPWRERMLIVGTGLAMAMNVSCWFMGVSYIGAALPTVISICCAPVMVALLSVLRGYERASGRLLAALLLALAGVALIVVPTQALALPLDYVAGLLWSFASAALYSLVVLGNARMPAHVPAVSASAWGMAVAALLMLVLASAQGLSWPQGSTAWLQVAYTGVATTSIAYLAFAWGARRLSPTATVVGTLIEPLVAALAAAWWLAEPLTARQGVGALLLGAAMLLLARRR